MIKNVRREDVQVDTVSTEDTTLKKEEITKQTGHRISPLLDSFAVQLAYSGSEY
ncbi:uncharacterized protein PHALS_02964 [Plasmopara halstedii]|uniref:Uncharacterized protein n=1 Tax=Plasmopara halstedii TaxID=4781 RepID=A0A0P1AYK1_PLAHL|nr:uncharacterized protein PHALS_02964 [Plasmopara halstedii]CEG46566.1 hypothetical protein PHALS_02964 [Plasmopara halstedii]|eukprot:XP_024582935.1 hypothetical protein PHALS_02964 [Plasmopara halstedii]